MANLIPHFHEFGTGPDKFKKVSMHSGRPICSSPGPLSVFPMLFLKHIMLIYIIYIVFMKGGCISYQNENLVVLQSVGSKLVY